MLQRNQIAQDPYLLSEHFDRPLRPIAEKAVRRWFNRDRLDEVLREAYEAYPDAELVYAIDIGGRQMSSNLHPDHTDRDAYWQDLSQRPIAVPLRALSDDNFRGAFVCDTYISQVTQHSCLTVMMGVRSDAALLGFIAIDFVVEEQSE